MSVAEPRSVAVIGAGAAGLMAAIHAAREGAVVRLYEGTRDGGRKILISGGGRCNVLPSSLDPSCFVTGSSPHLVRRLLLSWPLEEQRGFFEADLRVPLALEQETGKLFPKSNRARDVRDALVRAAAKAGAELSFERTVRGVVPVDGEWEVTTAGEGPRRHRVVVVATGGLSVPQTGSDGFGLDLAARLGHAVADPYPALTPLTSQPPVHAALAGLSLDVAISGGVGKDRVEARGGFLFTHRGYSGPAVLDVSHLAVRSQAAGSARVPLKVRWSGETAAIWDTRLRQRTAEIVRNVLRAHIPLRLADALLGEARVDPGRQLAQLTRQERHELVARLADYSLPWTGDEGYRKAEVTGGGLKLSEVNPDTLESRRHSGLHFCGEVLDAFGPIGGYNFAWAWATGRLAGLGAAA